MEMGRTIQNLQCPRPSARHLVIVLVALLSLVTVQACPANAGAVFVPQDLLDHLVDDLDGLQEIASPDAAPRCESCQASLLVHRVATAAQVFDLVAPLQPGVGQPLQRAIEREPGLVNEAALPQWLADPSPRPPRPAASFLNWL